MMREMATLQELKGNADHARELRAQADKLLPAVLTLYRKGDGCWDSIQTDGHRVEQRHCVDFIYVTQAIAPDLSAEMRREMLGFVNHELVMKNWMRAMSLKDPSGIRSARPIMGRWALTMAGFP